MQVRFSIDCVVRDQTNNEVLNKEREKRFAVLESELASLTGRRVEVWDDTQFQRIQFTFSDR